MLVDVTELINDFQNDPRFNMLRRFFPLDECLKRCHDYDFFYELLYEFDKNFSQGAPVGMKPIELETLEFQGTSFVDNYWHGFLRPTLESLNASNRFYVQGVTIHGQVVLNIV